MDSKKGQKLRCTDLSGVQKFEDEVIEGISIQVVFFD